MTAADPISTASAGRCPVCGKPAAPATRPFCSVRCADVDLGRWLTGHYRFPGSPLDQDGDMPQSEADPSDTK